MTYTLILIVLGVSVSGFQSPKDCYAAATAAGAFNSAAMTQYSCVPVPAGGAITPTIPIVLPPQT
jgi:hypothetical protein